MGVLINFLVENYIYFVFIAVLLILALIGYIVDNSKTKKEKEMESEESTIDIPVAALEGNVTLGSTVNKAVNKDNATVNQQAQTNSAEVPPVQPKGM